jgi:hypothetical protein
MKKERGRVPIARVVAGHSPASVRTFADWMKWREEEDERMRRELNEQIAAWFALRAGATKH